MEHVEPAVWAYTVSGKQVVKQWFSYRRKSRERPLIGDRRPPSPLGNIQPVCAGPLVTAAEVEAAISLDRPAAPGRRHDPDQTSMLE